MTDVKALISTQISIKNAKSFPVRNTSTRHRLPGAQDLDTGYTILSSVLQDQPSIHPIYKQMLHLPNRCFATCIK